MVVRHPKPYQWIWKSAPFAAGYKDILDYPNVLK